MSTPSPDEIKEQQRKTWANVADGWRRRHAMLANCSAPVTERMLELAGVHAGARVLDVASGSGEPALSAARRVGPQGRVVGTDLVEDMLVHARAHAREAGLDNVEFRCTDGEMLEFDAASFDCATMRWGLMFMPAPVEALARVHRVLKPGGRIALACWADPKDNPFVSVAIDTLREFRDVPQPPPGAPGMFAFADGERLTAALTAAGFEDVVLEAVEITAIEADDAHAYWAVLRDLAGPVSLLYGELDEAAKRAFEAALARRVEALSVGPRIGLHGRTWVAAGTRR